MPKIHSHYENLKVPRDATPDAIRAAYRSLVQKNHPDRNPGNADATRVMILLNTAYETLSDPVRRREHDEWIATAERGRTGQQARKLHHTRRRERSTEDAERRPRRSRKRTASLPAGRFVAHFQRNWFWYGLATIVLVWGLENTKPDVSAPAHKPAAANPAVVPSPEPSPAPAAPKYVRPAAAPNGQTWPETASYLRGYEILRNDGLSSVTIDNSQNGADLFLKLVHLQGDQPLPVRNVYIPAFASMTLAKVAAGRYDVRYRDLNSGHLSRTAAFNLKETPKPAGMEFSSVTISIIRGRVGNMPAAGLLEEEF